MRESRRPWIQITERALRELARCWQIASSAAAYSTFSTSPPRNTASAEIMKIVVVRKVGLFAAFIVALALINWVGAWIFGAVGYVAQRWLEYFVARDMPEVAIVAALVICIGSFVGVIIGIKKAEDWWRSRKMRRPLL